MLWAAGSRVRVGIARTHGFEEFVLKFEFTKQIILWLCVWLSLVSSSCLWVLVFMLNLVLVFILFLFLFLFLF